MLEHNTVRCLRGRDHIMVARHAVFIARKLLDTLRNTVHQHVVRIVLLVRKEVTPRPHACSHGGGRKRRDSCADEALALGVMVEDLAEVLDAKDCRYELEKRMPVGLCAGTEVIVDVLLFGSSVVCVGG